MQKSLIEFAYEFVAKQKNPVAFLKIWEYVKKEAGLTEEEAAIKGGQFFTNLSLDGRFVALSGNEWDLRERQSFDKVHIDMKDVYSEVETSDVDAEEAADEKDYLSVFDEDEDKEKVEDTEEGDDDSDTDSDTF